MDAYLIAEALKQIAQLLKEQNEILLRMLEGENKW